MHHLQPRQLDEGERAVFWRRSLDLLDLDYQTMVARAGTWTAAALGPLGAELKAASTLGCRCTYCEVDQVADIDHLRPKSLWPQLTWCWENLVPACAYCNSRKKQARDAVLDAACDSGFREITRRKGGAVVPPPDGPTAWWSPQRRDPQQGFTLELVDDIERGRIYPRARAPSADHARARWTIDVLELNRAHLWRARRSSFEDYLRWLQEVVRAIGSNDPQRLARLRRELVEDKGPPFVWREMKLQRERLPELDDLLRAAPDVLTW